MGWQWHQLDHMQDICTSLKTDNHTSISSLNFYRQDALPDTQPTPPPSYRGYQSNDLWLEGKRENYHVCSAQYCVQQLCTVQCAHILTNLPVVCWLDLAFLWLYCVSQFVCLRFNVLGLFCKGVNVTRSSTPFLVHLGQSYIGSVSTGGNRGFGFLPLNVPFSQPIRTKFGPRILGTKTHRI